MLKLFSACHVLQFRASNEGVPKTYEHNRSVPMVDNLHRRPGYQASQTFKMAAESAGEVIFRVGEV